MKKTIWLVIIILVVLGLYHYFYNTANAPAAPETNNNQPTPPVSTKNTEPSPDAPLRAPVSYNISIENFNFSKPSLAIKKGDTVVWTNKDSTSHTISGLDLDSGTLSPGQSFSYTFGSTGTFSYHCNFHPFMTGTVTVTN